MFCLGVIVALGTDFNPNAYCLSMPVAMYLACILFRMSLEEALVASTINAAASIGRGKTHGALHNGRVADIVMTDVPSWEHVIYRIPSTGIIKAVFKGGKCAWKE